MKDVAHEFKVKIECQARSKLEQTALDKRPPHSSSLARTFKKRAHPEPDFGICLFHVSPTALDLIPNIVRNKSTATLSSHLSPPIDVPLPLLSAFEIHTSSCCNKNTPVLSFDMTHRPQRVPHPPGLHPSKPPTLPTPS